MANKSKNFNNCGAELDKVIAAAERGMEKAVTAFQNDTMNLTHVQTGALKRSWTHKTESKNGNVEGAVGSNLVYAPYEDDLHGNLSVALEENKQQYMDMIANEIKAGIGG